MNIPGWVPIELLRGVFAILAEHGEARLVGGCVRDIIIGEISKDLDIATTVHPEQLQKLLVNHGIKVIPTGIKHGTVTVVIGKYILEITTLRKDIECFGRHATVEFTDDWKEDARRRDFTINAMSMDLDGNIYDYFNGREDLDKRIIRFVGAPEQRINEDHLRILRYFRFYACFGDSNSGDSSLTERDPAGKVSGVYGTQNQSVLNVHEDLSAGVRPQLSAKLKLYNQSNKSLAAVSKYAYTVTNLSGERIKQEIFKMLGKPYALDAIKLMIKVGVWEHLDCESPNVNILNNYQFCNDVLINLAAIINATDNPKSNINRIRIRWRLSNKEVDILEMLCSKEYDIKTDNIISAKRVIYLLGKYNFLMKLKLKSVEEPNQDLKGLYKLIEEFEIPVFPLRGKDVKKLGFQGKEIGEKILYATNAWINSDFKLQKEELMELIKR